MRCAKEPSLWVCIFLSLSLSVEVLPTKKISHLLKEVRRDVFFVYFSCFLSHLVNSGEKILQRSAYKCVSYLSLCVENSAHKCVGIPGPLEVWEPPAAAASTESVKKPAASRPRCSFKARLTHHNVFNKLAS